MSYAARCYAMRFRIVVVQHLRASESVDPALDVVLSTGGPVDVVNACEICKRIKDVGAQRLGVGLFGNCVTFSWVVRSKFALGREI